MHSYINENLEESRSRRKSVDKCNSKIKQLKFFKHQWEFFPLIHIDRERKLRRLHIPGEKCRTLMRAIGDRRFPWQVKADRERCYVRGTLIADSVYPRVLIKWRSLRSQRPVNFLPSSTGLVTPSGLVNSGIPYGWKRDRLIHSHTDTVQPTYFFSTESQRLYSSAVKYVNSLGAATWVRLYYSFATWIHDPIQRRGNKFSLGVERGQCFSLHFSRSK